jgi:DNA primase
MTAGDLAKALNARKSGSGWMAKCPAHEDRSPSLRIDEKNGRVLCHCFGGCRQSEVIQKLTDMGLWDAEKLSPEQRQKRELARHYQEQIRRRKLEQAAVLDVIKQKALDSENWDGWKRACQLQYRLVKEAQC